MKLCFLGQNLTYLEGIPNLSINLISHLAKNEEVDGIHVICGAIDSEALHTIKHKKVSVQLAKLPKKGDVLRIVQRNIRYLLMLQKLSEFEIFHAIDCRTLPLIGSKLHPLVVTIHDVMVDECVRELKTIGFMGINRALRMVDHYPPQFLLEFLSAKRADGIIVNSPIAEKRLRELYGNVVSDKTRVIPAGFDPARFNPYSISKPYAKRVLKIDQSSKVLLHIGGSRVRKGLFYLLKALDFMHKSGELERLDVRLLVVGEIERRYKQLFPSIEEYTTELPYVQEELMPIVYRAADVLVMPSTSEGWGIALIEALASGTPVLASRYVPAAHATLATDAVRIEDDVSDYQRLARSIISSLSSETFSDLKWRKIFDVLNLNYSWKNIASSTLNVYRKLLN
jgi:glycosyltransferase involved in cell wall biosynthesis